MESKGSLIGNKVILNKDVASRNMISDAFSESKSYAVGDTCIYENKLYKCKTATSGTWDATKWDETTVGAYASELKGTLDNIATNFSYQTLASGNYASTSANYEYVGLNFTIPTGKHGLVTVSTVYISKNPLGLGIGTSDSTWSTATKQYWLDLDSIKYTPAILLDAGTYYIWAKRDGASSNNPYYVKGLVF